MNNQSIKIQRRAILIKCFMALVMITLAVQFYETKVIDLGLMAGTIGVLSMLRGVLASPHLLSNPIKSWLKSNNHITKESLLYFIFAFVLIVVGAL